MTSSHKDSAYRAGLKARAAQAFERSASRSTEHRATPNRLHSASPKPLRVMKFGGTSVGDAACIRRVVEIVRAALQDSEVVVVVSAMSGVTNQFVEAASQSELGGEGLVAEILETLWHQHRTAATELIPSPVDRGQLVAKIEDLLQTGRQLCESTMRLRELTPRTLDSISSLGERLSVLLVAAALAEHGIASNAIEATEFVVTDGLHGAASPCTELTKTRCAARLRPLLQSSVVPVVTGFIGATCDGILTTLGRGGSDYSATIVAAALGADEVIIWTDVDGLQTADPRLVPGARTITEVSYREAAELAYFGAKVLHPKTLRPVMQRGIPLWIRNTFAPEKPGTRITPKGLPGAAGLKAVTSFNDAALISITVPPTNGIQGLVKRSLQALATARVDVLLTSQASSPEEFSVVVPLAQSKAALAALRREFANSQLANHAEPQTVKFKIDPAVSVVTVVGKNLNSLPALVSFAVEALERAGIGIAAVGQNSSNCSLSLAVPRHAMKASVISVYEEFHLGIPGFVDFDPAADSVVPSPTTQPLEQIQ
jgi:aspartokinase/homoserine dehydrogenase 1